MWIRSQDRRVLIKVNFAYVPSYEKSVWVPTENDSFSIGTYASQERALEVLDEIQHAICYHKATEIMGLKMDGLSEGIINGFVYQMPEK